MPKWYRERYFIKTAKEIGSGHLLWLIRDAIATNGYYSNGRYPREYLRALADQLESACNQGTLECHSDLKIPMVGSIRAAHVPIIFRFFIEDIYGLLKSEEEHLSIASLDTGEQARYGVEFDYFREFAYNPLDPLYPGEIQGKNGLVAGKRDIRLLILHYKEVIMKDILKIYKTLTLPVTMLLCLGWVILLIFNLIKRRRGYSFQALYIFAFLWGLLLSREMVLAIFAATTNGSPLVYDISSYLFIYISLFLMAFYLFDHIGQLISLERIKTRMPSDK
jgi:hypothetical protein